MRVNTSFARTTAIGLERPGLSPTISVSLNAPEVGGTAPSLHLAIDKGVFGLEPPSAELQCQRGVNQRGGMDG